MFVSTRATSTMTFTLPTLAEGLRYKFYNEGAASINVTAAAADTIVTLNDAAADSISFSTAGEKIGGGFEFHANVGATKWLCTVLATETQTVTINT